jgi:hypothetical protein
MAFSLRPSALLHGLIDCVGEVLREDLLALEGSIRSRFDSVRERLSKDIDAVRTDLRDDLPVLEARLKAHTEALVKETRAVMLREMRAEFETRLGGGTTSAPTELPRLPRFVEPIAPAGLPPGRPHP